ncbi:hypothetical protein AVEN_153979-1 [Araneus ventricosus]|uniref:Secreted protein n=1 Tax=Araneus ventricosus TaxID=182803 RepID=A0A4Y2ITU7_ARAVE|nr:hypothetical protein AVEN_153979-1 [Araneus ventricosus]
MCCPKSLFQTLILTIALHLQIFRSSSYVQNAAVNKTSWCLSACHYPQTIAKGCFVSGICRSVVTSLAKGGAAGGEDKQPNRYDRLFYSWRRLSAIPLSLAIPQPLYERPSL